jgi:molybdopterin-containing oxidoreductase family membrane subunit
MIIFPPYFVAGVIFSGFAMVITLMVFARTIFKMEHIITMSHMDSMAKVILLTGSVVGYAYAMEFFIAWYSGNPYEQFAFINRAFGDYAWAYWIMVSCNVISPQIFWSRKMRRNIKVLFIVLIFVNIGMWFERFVIIVTSLSADFLPSSWGYYSPTIFDVAALIGSFGLFFTLFLLFLRYLPMIAMAEVKAILPQADPHYHPEDHGNDDGHADATPPIPEVTESPASETAEVPATPEGGGTEEAPPPLPPEDESSSEEAASESAEAVADTDGDAVEEEKE